MSLLPRFTDAGKALQLRALDGEEIRFTKIQMGSGRLGETSYKTFNSLLEPKVTIPITEIDVTNGYAAIRGYFNNEKLTEGFYYRELGLFAKDPDDETKEILYCYGNTGEQASYIAEPGSVLIERSIKIIAVVDDAENVSAVINGSAVYVDFVELRKAVESHNADVNAHADMRSSTLTLYVDCNSTEDDELCDGSYEHPFKDLGAVEYSYPDYIRTLNIVLKSAGDYVLSFDMHLGYSNLESVSIRYNDSTTLRPNIHGFISFGDLDNVYISKVNFVYDNLSWSTYAINLWFESCNNVYIYDVTSQNKTTNSVNFIESYSSNVNLNSCQTINVHCSVSAWTGSTIHLHNCYFEEPGEYAINCENSVVFNYDMPNVPVTMNDSGLIFSPEIISKISNGDLIKHLVSTENPHRVSLDQAQQEGGMIDVSHGGTGQKTFTAGALLKGNGTGAVGMVSGTGAVYATTSGNPKFGTLPVSMGGTGMKDFPTKNALVIGGGPNMPLTVLNPANGVLYQNGGTLAFGTLPVMFGGTGTTGLKSHLADSAVDGARHGHLVLAFGSGPKILVCWGRISPDIGESVTVNFSTRCGNYFKDNVYTLIFSGNDIENGKITKNNTDFVIDSAIVARAADWIAIGEVHS